MLVEKWLGRQLGESSSQANYTFAKYDLNQNSQDEYLVLMSGPDFCDSGGCSAFLFDNNGHEISYFTVARPPIAVSIHIHNGWHDLVIWSNGAPRVMVHDGDRYPTNPSTQPKSDETVLTELIH